MSNGAGRLCFAIQLVLQQKWCVIITGLGNVWVCVHCAVMMLSASSILHCLHSDVPTLS